MVARSEVMDSIAVLDDRVRTLQANAAREAAKAADAHDALARAVAEQDTAHAVLAQWMKDWTSEVSAWRKCMETRQDEADSRLTQTGRELEQARGAMKVALWVLGTALTLVTGVFSGVMVRLLGELMSRAGG